MSWKGCGSGRGLIKNNIQALAWRDWRKARRHKSG